MNKFILRATLWLIVRIEKWEKRRHASKPLPTTLKPSLYRTKQSGFRPSHSHEWLSCGSRQIILWSLSPYSLCLGGSTATGAAADKSAHIFPNRSTSSSCPACTTQRVAKTCSSDSVCICWHLEGHSNQILSQCISLHRWCPCHRQAENK